MVVAAWLLVVVVVVVVAAMNSLILAGCIKNISVINDDGLRKYYC